MDADRKRADAAFPGLGKAAERFHQLAVFLLHQHLCRRLFDRDLPQHQKFLHAEAQKALQTDRFMFRKIIEQLAGQHRRFLAALRRFQRVAQHRLLFGQRERQRVGEFRKRKIAEIASEDPRKRSRRGAFRRLAAHLQQNAVRNGFQRKRVVEIAHAAIDELR